MRSSEVRRVRPRPGLAILRPAQLWQFRDLGLLLALRDMRVRYKQTVLGVAWAVLQPLAMMGVATVVMGQILGLNKQVDGSYPVFVYAGMVPWLLVSGTVTAASHSLVAHAEVLKKVYFPRLLVPISAVGAPLADCLVAGSVLLLMMAWAGQGFSWQLALLPLIGASLLVGALGVGIGLAALTVTYRDFRLLVPFVLQLWFFLTPVVYPLPAPASWGWVLCLNPVYGPIRACRAAVLNQPIDVGAWVASVCVGGLGLLAGLIYFSRTERRFADVI